MYLLYLVFQQPLREPIVSCALGKLYNKDAIIEYLIDKTSYGDGGRICGHIRNLKDVTTLKLTPNAAPIKSTANGDHERAPFMCPLTMKEMNGAQPFVYISTCGCVMSQAGLRTLANAESPSPSTDNKPTRDSPKTEEGEPKLSVETEAVSSSLSLCPNCGVKYLAKSSVRTLNPSPEEEEEMQVDMERQRLLEPVKKKKRKAEDETTAAVARASKKKSSMNSSGSSTMLSAALAAEEAKRKAGMSEAVKSLYTSSQTGKPKKETFTTMNTFTRVSINSLFYV
jgi:hypothetical protein